MLIEVDRFKSLHKNKKKPNPTARNKLTTDSTGDNSSSQDGTNISSRNPPHLDTQDVNSPKGIQPPSPTPAPLTKSPTNPPVTPAIVAPDKPPTEVIIPTEKSLTKQGYSSMKNTALQEAKV